MSAAGGICAPDSGVSDRAATALAILKVREIDAKLNELVQARSDEVLNGTVLHPWAGLEVLSVGIAAARARGDLVFATHRGLGHLLAWGVDPHRAIAEALGRETGFARGRGGHMHVVDAGAGIGGTNGIVGAGLPLAVGAALSIQVRGLANLAVAFIGDGATNTGSFHESLNLAKVWNLPLVVVCEDNGITEAMRSEEQCSAPSLAARGEVYGMAVAEADGDDVAAVNEAASAAFARARAGGGPSFIVSRADRPGGHYAGDRQHYRDEHDAERAAHSNPAARAIERLGLSDADFERLRREASTYAEGLVASALDDEPPSRGTLLIGAEDVAPPNGETVT